MKFKSIIPAAFVATMAIPALAQDIGAQNMGEPHDPAANENAMMDDGLTPEKQAQYDAWPVEVRNYYQSLSPDRQKLFWRMSDGDKVSLAAMTPEDQEAVWRGIEKLPQTTLPMDQ